MKSPVRILVFLAVLSLASIPCGHSIQTQPNTNVISINADGSVQPSNAPLTRNGEVYTLTGNFSGEIAVHRSNIVIDGAFHTLNGDGTLRGAGIDLDNNVTNVPGPNEIWNVTIKNLAIINFDFSIDTNGGGNDTFYNDYIANTLSGLQGGIFFWACRGNHVSYCTISGEPAVYMHFCASDNTVTHCNFAGGIDPRISGGDTVDSNYFADYRARYPNASELGNSGVWDTPYFYNTSNTLTIDSVQDNHPLVNPIAPMGWPNGMPASVETKIFSTPPAQGSPDQISAVSCFFILPIAATIGLAIIIWMRRKRNLQISKTG